MKEIAAVLLWLFGIVFYYALCSYTLSTTRLNMVLKKCKKRDIGMIAMFIFLITVFVYLRIKNNQFVYYWDYGGYWTKSVEFTKIFFAHPKQACISLYQSILYDEYNLLPVIFIASPIKLFGNSFQTFVMINHFMFMIPTFLTCAFTMVYLCAKDKKNIEKYLLAALLVLTFAIYFYHPLLIGAIDVICLLPVCISLLLLFELDFTKKVGKQDGAIALLLVTILILRRYFAFYILAYVCVLFLKAALSWRKEKKGKQTILHIVTIGVISLGILLIFFREFFIRELTTNYGKMYVAWQFLKPSQVLIVCICIVIVLAIIFILCKRQHTNMLEVLLLGTMIIVEAVCFLSMQSLSYQHVYLFVVQVYILLYFCVVAGWKAIHKESIRKRVFCIGAVLYMILFFFYYKIPPCFNHNVNEVVDKYIYIPFERGDMSELGRLVNQLNEMTGGTEKTIYVTASGAVLNYDILNSYAKPDTLSAVNGLVLTHDADLRDGFPNQFMNVDYVVVTNPVQLHLAEGTQKVVTFFNEEIQNENSPIGRHYRKTDLEYLLDDDVEAIIYEKVNDLTNEDVKYIYDYFTESYPDNEDIFKDRISSFLDGE